MDKVNARALWRSVHYMEHNPTKTKNLKRLILFQFTHHFHIPFIFFAQYELPPPPRTMRYKLYVFTFLALLLVWGSVVVMQIAALPIQFLEHFHIFNPY